MSINLVVGKNCYKKDKIDGKKIHYMPCKIKFDGPVKFSNYMKSREASDEKDVLTASFHGHPIHGREVKCPEKYVGIVFEKSKNFDGPDKKVYATHGFDSFLHWNWDKIPNKNDTIVKALDWIEIAEALHAAELAEPDTGSSSAS